jgi:hypothetical protein
VRRASTCQAVPSCLRRGLWEGCRKWTAGRRGHRDRGERNFLTSDARLVFRRPESPSDACQGFRPPRFPTLQRRQLAPNRPGPGHRAARDRADGRGAVDAGQVQYSLTAWLGGTPPRRTAPGSPLSSGTGPGCRRRSVCCPSRPQNAVGARDCWSGRRPGCAARLLYCAPAAWAFHPKRRHLQRRLRRRDDAWPHARSTVLTHAGPATRRGRGAWGEIAGSLETIRRDRRKGGVERQRCSSEQVRVPPRPNCSRRIAHSGRDTLKSGNPLPPSFDGLGGSPDGRESVQ